MASIQKDIFLVQSISNGKCQPEDKEKTIKFLRRKPKTDIGENRWQKEFFSSSNGMTNAMT